MFVENAAEAAEAALGQVEHVALLAHARVVVVVIVVVIIAVVVVIVVVAVLFFAFDSVAKLRRK